MENRKKRKLRSIQLKNELRTNGGYIMIKLNNSILQSLGRIELLQMIIKSVPQNYLPKYKTVPFFTQVQSGWENKDFLNDLITFRMPIRLERAR